VKSAERPTLLSRCAISALAEKLRGFGLRADTVVAMQLSNTVESIVAFLGVLRAGMR
jgi:acyl-CoA synthetase (AMP-forming)/AMP-acid ligase II